MCGEIHCLAVFGLTAKDSQFTSQQFGDFFKIIEIYYINWQLTLSYYPPSNGLARGAAKTVKDEFLAVYSVHQVVLLEILTYT